MTFDDVFALVIGFEKGFTDSPADAGNWTGGKVGVGSCRGTKYGISAASYPDLDIGKLTLEQAKAIARRDYWTRYHCDEFDPRIGAQVFDAAYNGGHPALWLQQASGAKPDGVIGAATVASVKAADPVKICARFDAYRLDYMASLDAWPSFSRGWTHRIATMLRESAA
jgi:lysozyme family protein